MADANIDNNYVGNMRTMKFHVKNCRWAKKISKGNEVVFESREEAIKSGFNPCKICHL